MAYGQNTALHLTRSLRLRARGRGSSLPLLILVALVGGTYEASGRTLDEALHLAVQSHPAIAEQSFEAKAADREVGAAFAGYFPTLSVDGSIRREKTERPGFERTLTADEYSVTLRQPIFDGLGTPARVSAARSDANAETQEAAAALNRVALETVAAYLDVLSAQEKVELLTRHLSSAGDISDRIERRANADRGLRSLTVVGRSNVEEARFLLLEAERDLVLARTRYQELVGEAPQNLVIPTEPFEIATLTEDAALARATANHPVLAASRARAMAASGSRRSARADLFPRLDAELKARNGNNIEGIRGADDDYYAGLRLTYQFSLGGADIYELRAADYREQAAQAQIQDVARQVRLAVLDAFETYRSNVTSHAILMNRRAAATQLVGVYDAQFAGGRRDLLDLFFVLNEQRSASRAELDARYEKLRAAYTLLAATGDLGSSLSAHVAE